jgi:hypothetical protein
MSTTTNSINELGASMKKLHDDLCDLMFRVESIMTARKALGLTRDVKGHCSYRLTTCISTVQMTILQRFQL